MPKKKEKKKNQLFRVRFERTVVDNFLVAAPSKYAATLWAREIAPESDELQELIKETDHEREFNSEYPELVFAKVEPIGVHRGRPVYPVATLDGFGQEIQEDEDDDNA
jgi:hypothetical protein